MRPISAQLGQAHGLPKTPKVFTDIPKFCPIIDTTNTPYYKTEQCLSSLLQPLTKNNYTLKDSFDTANKIKSIPSEIFEDGYQFGSSGTLSFYSRMCLSIKPSILF